MCWISDSLGILPEKQNNKQQWGRFNSGIGIGYLNGIDHFDVEIGIDQMELSKIRIDKIDPMFDIYSWIFQ